MHPQYAETLKEVRCVYDASDVVRQTVNEKAQSFCMRSASEQSIAQCRDFESSVNYILEEVAAFAVMFKETRAVDIYPGAWFKEVFEAIVQAQGGIGSMVGFTDVSCLRVDFVKNKLFSGQL